MHAATHPAGLEGPHMSTISHLCLHSSFVDVFVTMECECEFWLGWYSKRRFQANDVSLSPASTFVKQTEAV